MTSTKKRYKCLRVEQRPAEPEKGSYFHKIHLPEQALEYFSRNDIVFFHKVSCVFCLFVFGGTGVSTQSFMLAKQALYCLSHISSPFCSGYF
jgi:hypothetical protein